MPVDIELPDGRRATFQGYRWQSDTAGLATYLDFYTRMKHPHGPEGWDPNPEYTVTHEVVEWLGGRIVAQRGSPVPFGPRVLR